MKWFLTITFFFFFTTCYSQNARNNRWYFGNQVGLDFSSGIPQPFYSPYHLFAGNTHTFTDRNGNVLLYTDGLNYTRTYWLDTINVDYNKLFSLGGKGGYFNRYNRFISNNDSLTTQSNAIIILQHPLYDSLIYHIFSPPRSTLAYSLIDLGTNGGEGSFVDGKKNVKIERPDNYYGNNATPPVYSSTLHANGRDRWVISFLKADAEPVSVNFHKLYRFVHLITPDSFYLQSMDSVSIFNNQALPNSAKFNNKGNKIIVSYSRNSFLFDFDNRTGTFSSTIIPIFTPQWSNFLGNPTVFSPNDSLLYYSRPIPPFDILQYRVYDPNPNASLFSIPGSGYQSISRFVKRPGFGSTNVAGIQLGPDGKMYIGRCFSDTLDVIHNPDVYGSGCGFQRGYLPLGDTNRIVLYSFVTTSLNANLIPPRFSGCAPLRVSFPNPRPGALWYDWRFLDDSTFSSSPTPVRTYTRGGQHGVIIRVGLPGGQVDSSFFTVMVYDPPSRLYRYKSDTVCLGAVSRFSLDTLGLQNMRFQVLLNGSPLAPDSLWFYHARLATLGTHTVRVIATNTFTQCRDTTDFPLVVRPKPTASLLLQDSLACTPFALPFAVSGSDSAFLLSNRWGRRSLQFSSGSWRDSLLYAAPTCDSLRMVRTNAFGCSDTSALRKFCALAPPQARFSLSDTESCGFVYVRLLDSSRHVFGQSGAYLQWDFGDGSPPLRLNQPSGGSVFHAFQQSGVFNIRLIAFNGRCTDTLLLPQTITITPAPQPGIGVSGSVKVDSLWQNGLLRRSVRGCLPLAVSLVDLSSGARDSVRFFLNGQPIANLNLSFNTPGNALITQRVFGSTGCITTDTLRVVVTARPQLTSLLLVTLKSCGRQQLRLRATPLNTDSLFLNWAVPGANASSILVGSSAFTNLSPTFTQSGIATWTIRMKGGGCEDTLSSGFPVNVRPPTQAALLPTDSLVCVGKIAVLVNQTQFADSLWLGTQPPGGTGFSYQTLTLSALQPTLSTPGNWRFALVAHSVEGCRDTAFAAVRVLPPLSFSYTYTDSLACGKVFRTLRMQSGDSVQVSQGGSPLVPLAPGHWQFVLTGIDSLRLRIRIANIRCDSLITLTIPYQVRPLPQLIFRSDSLQACLPFVSQHYILNRNLDSLFWRLGGSWNRLSPLPDSAQLPYNWTLPFSAPYSGELRLRWATVEGCVGDTLVGQVEVKNPPVLFASLSPNSGCRPLDALLNLQLAHADTLRWSSDSLSGVRVSPPANLRLPLRFWANDSLRISVTNGLCDADTALPIVIRGFSNLPGLRITASRADSLGETERIRIFWNPLSEAKFYRIERSLDSLNWRYLADVGGDNWTDPLAEVQLPYYYRVTAFDTCGNAAFAFRPIRHLVISSRWTSTRQESLLLSSPGSESTANLHLHRRWLGDELLRQESSLVIAPFNQSFSNLTDGLTHEQTLGFRFLLHHLTQEESGYWRRSNTLRDTLSSLLLLPDAFSPNSDQLNDALRPVGIGLQDLTLRVWNRWGELLYEGQGSQAAWNGQHNQQPAPTGLYLVRITATGNDGKPMEVVKQVWVK